MLTNTRRLNETSPKKHTHKKRGKACFLTLSPLHGGSKIQNARTKEGSENTRGKWKCTPRKMWEWSKHVYYYRVYLCALLQRRLNQVPRVATTDNSFPISYAKQKQTKNLSIPATFLWSENSFGEVAWLRWRGDQSSKLDCTASWFTLDTMTTATDTNMANSLVRKRPLTSAWLKIHLK